MSLITQIFAGPPPSRDSGGGGGGGGSYDGGASLRSGGPEGVLAQALVNSTVYRCASLIGGTSAALPARVMRRGDQTRTELRREQDRVIWGKPNEMTRRINLWESAYTACLVTGDAHLWKSRPVGSLTGPVQELWYLPPYRVRTGLASDSTKVFELDRDRTRGYTTREIMHVPALSTNGVKGFPPIDAITRPFNIIAAAGAYGERFLRKGSTIAGVISTEAELDQDEADEIKARWRRDVAGLQNSHEVIVMGHGATFVPVAVSPEQAQYVQTLEHWELRIAQAYGIPPHMLGIVDKSTSWGSGIESQVIGFVQFTLLSWIIRFEQAIDDELLPADLSVKFVLNGLLRGDTIQRFASYRSGITSGIYSPDEVRELEDMAPRPDGRGGIYVDPTAASSGMQNGGGDPALQPGMRLVTPAAAQLLPGERAFTTADRDDFVEVIAMTLREQHYAERTEETLSTLLPEGRCPNCNKLLARNVNAGSGVRCPRCKKVVPVAAAKAA